MKRIFIIDWCLVPLFLAAVFTGTVLHIVGHGNSHELWHYRIGLLSLVLFSGHIIRRIPVLRKKH